MTRHGREENQMRQISSRSVADPKYKGLVMGLLDDFSLSFSDDCTSTAMKNLKSKVNVSKELWKAAGEPFGNTNYEPVRNGSFPLSRESVKDWYSIASLQNRPPLKAMMNNLERSPYKILNMHKILAKGLIKYTSPACKKTGKTNRKLWQLQT